MIHSPQQELFDSLFLISERLGHNTYNHNPPDNVEYPFVVIDPFSKASRRLSKHKLGATLNGVIHVWHHAAEIGEHDKIMNKLDKTVTQLTRMGDIPVELVSINPSTMVVNEGNENLRHGTIQVSFLI